MVEGKPFHRSHFGQATKNGALSLAKETGRRSLGCIRTIWAKSSNATLSRSFNSLGVRVLLGRFLVFVFGKHDVQNDGDRSCGDNARAAENQADKLGRTSQHGGVRTNAVA